MTKWTWEKRSADHGGAAGDITKLFRAQPIEPPGVLALEAPSPTASLMAREVIQNSWDSARERRDHDAAAPPFELTFRFTESESLWAPLGLGELAQRAQALGSGSELLQPNCLDATGTAAVPLIRIDERGTTGMGGSWRDTRSKLYLALVSIGFTEKAHGAGGSYGYGKAGMIGASRIRTVVAYTCFPESPDEPGVTRRLLGMSYWKPHELEGGLYTGFGRFGRRQGESALPFENDEADEVARNLGLDVRRPDDPGARGTSFLVLDPHVEPDDLVRAIEYFWWPALQDASDFDVTVVADGEEYPPRPRKREALKAFIRGFELATTRQDNKRADEKAKQFNRVRIGDRQLALGSLGLVADPAGWSFPPPDDGVDDHQSLVAQVRGPRMVVAYEAVRRNPPYVRGTYVAHDDIDDLLRQTEPKAHDRWVTKGADGDIAEEALEAARTVRKRILSTVDEFRRELKPPVSTEGVRLPELDKLFRGGVGGRAPEPTAREATIRLSQSLVPDGSHIRLEGEATLAPAPGLDDGEYAVSITYKFLEDGRSGDECPLDIGAPDGWERTTDTTFRGVLRSASPSTFAFRSHPYDPDWSGRLLVSATRLGAVSSAAEGEQP